MATPNYFVVTVATARSYSGPGTQIHWRPNTNRVSNTPDEDRATVIYVSTPEDSAIAARALAREEAQRVRLKK